VEQVTRLEGGDVPVGYVVTVALVALGTLFALVPLRSVGNLSFRMGLLLNEVPIVGSYWLLIWTCQAFVQGDIDAAGGWAAVGLAALTTAGLAVVAWRGLQARPALEQAMAEALGADWRTAIDPGLASRLRRRLPLARILLLPLSRRRLGVERVANLRYGDAGRRNLLDLYRHRARPSGGPVLIHLHGGGYTGGRKNSQSLPLLYRLASQGWVCVSANYRLRPAAQHPDHLIDLKQVIAWVRAHGHEYGADPTLLFVAGSSAGAHMASLAALTPNDPAFQPGFEDADTSVTAAIGLNGWYGNYYGEGAPPHRWHMSERTRRRSSSRTATTTPWRPWRSPGISPTRWATSPPIRSSTPSFPAPSMPSTCFIPSVSRWSSTPSKPSPPGYALARSGRITISGWSPSPSSP
jgi:acetyl esterase/lipase